MADLQLFEIECASDLDDRPIASLARGLNGALATGQSELQAEDLRLVSATKESRKHVGELAPRHYLRRRSYLIRLNSATTNSIM